MGFVPTVPALGSDHKSSKSKSSKSKSKSKSKH
jgi:hypothetical protein